MKLIIESIDKIVTVNGVPARIWEGNTESGIPVHAYITLVAIAQDAPPEHVAEFERELREVRPPSAVVSAIPTRLVL